MGIASKEYFMWSFSKIILTYRTVVNKLDHLASKPTAHQSSKLRRKEGFSHRLRTKEEKVFLKFTYESKKSLWKHLLGEREDGQSCNKNATQVFPHYSWWSAKWFHMYFMSARAQ